MPTRMVTPPTLHDVAVLREKGRDNLSADDIELLLRIEPIRGARIAPDGNRFAWGPIVAVHSVGDIDVVEYLRDCSDHSKHQPYVRLEHGMTFFSSYVDKGSISTSYLTLDSALVGAIAYKRRGPNDRSAHAFDLMTLGVIPDEH